MKKPVFNLKKALKANATIWYSKDFDRIRIAYPDGIVEMLDDQSIQTGDLDWFHSCWTNKDNPAEVLTHLSHTSAFEFVGYL